MQCKHETENLEWLNCNHENVKTSNHETLKALFLLYLLYLLVPVKEEQGHQWALVFCHSRFAGSATYFDSTVFNVYIVCSMLDDRNLATCLKYLTCNLLIK